MKTNTKTAFNIAKMLAAMGVEGLIPEEELPTEIGGVSVSLTPDPETREGQPEGGELPS